ncbi:GmrSD restriction endonuclease domain-containing protein [Bifidobacterium samirii]|uniref:GmrSD restriction endonucleases N-terminal domain-containing protein n=1 Tax=Bifidobacterium samirii TaxID=2306974 RepID=A0A430FVM9_9BIFI|nr:DUF262 domain-containing protein [Bifidobacterium samirii]RSX58050.1 hypothetical protein D2E24_0410 [Bifidobacterium samirii]
MNQSEIREELLQQRRKVDFDNYDLTVDEVIRRVSSKRIEIAPSYQRQFRWNAERQSALIESLLLGIPIPNLFMATNLNENDGMQWEIVDGLQRTLSLVSFAGTETQRIDAGLSKEPLKIQGLQKLKSINDLTFDELPKDTADLFLDRPVKITVLNDKSDKQVRFDLFERLNTGGVTLTPQEVRECIFRGDFMDMLQDLSQYGPFREVVKLPLVKEKDGTREEYVLRFFAFYDRYKEFNHSVKDFLNSYTDFASSHVDLLEEKTLLFKRTFDFLAECFPNGLTRSRSTTPVNFYEGVSVGAALALKKNSRLEPSNDQCWMESREFVNSVIGATNSAVKVRRRIELSRDGFLSA